LGIGLVIFVHEAGHFLVAKKCGVRVEIFSLGFGPRLCGFRGGDTDYRLSLVPIGGYVKMAGDNPGEALEGDDSELPSKSIAQRFAIFSAGVVMNLIFAAVTLPLVLAVGVNFHSTVVGGVSPGGPAWKAGLQPDDEVTRVNGHEVYDFNDVVAGIALGDPEGVSLEFVREGKLTERLLRPEYNEELGRYTVGIRPSMAETLDVAQGSPAEVAGVLPSDRVLSVNGATVNSIDEFDLQRRDNREQRVALELLGTDGNVRSVEFEPRREKRVTKLVGIRPYLNHVRALRGQIARHGAFLLPGDFVRELVLQPGQAAETRRPVRDPAELKDALEIAASSGLSASFRVLRNGQLTMVPVPEGIGSEVAPDIALVQDEESCFVRLLDGYPAQTAGLPEDSQILKVNDKLVRSWDDIKQEIEDSKGAVALLYEHGGRQASVSVTPHEENRLIDFGLLPVLATVQRKYGVLQATKVGIVEAGFMLKNVFLTLKKIFIRHVSPKNLSGILTIGYVSKELAASGIPSLFFFLAVLSLNLAFLNVLPIPILDGGHLFFLLIEKIKGSPVSDRVMGYSQLVGLVLVLALLLYVTYQDLLKLLAT
jgi:regulator of sigma E protease